MMLGHLVHYVKKNKLALYFIWHLKINIKWPEDQNMKGETIKLKEENTKEYLVID